MAHIKRFDEFKINESSNDDLPVVDHKDSKPMTPEQLSNKERNQFKKGSVPFNKGLSREDYMSPDKIEKVEKTQFKTGVTTGENHPSWKGGIQQSKRDGGHIHTGTNERKRIARYNYEKEYGEIPKGWIIYHIDKNKDNDEIDNLIAVPRAILISLNNNRMNSNYHEIKTAVENYLSSKKNK